MILHRALDVPSGGILGIAALLVVGAALAYLGIAIARRLIPALAEPRSSWSALDLVVVIAVFLLAQPVVQIVIPGADVRAAIVQTQINFMLALVPVFLVARSMPGGPAALGVAWNGGARAIVAGVLAYVLFIPAFRGVMEVASWLAREAGWKGNTAHIVEELHRLSAEELALVAGLAVVLGPLLEELLFRGFLQSFASQRFGRTGGVFVAALVFAPLHGVADALPVFTLSLLLGWLRQRTQSILAPWAVHSLNNGLTLYLALRWGIE